MHTNGRLWLTVAASLTLTCHAQANRPAAQAPSASSTPRPAPKRFDPSGVRPSAAVREARAILEAHDPEEAEDRVLAALEQAPAPDRPRLRWLLARSARDREAPEPAIRHLRALAEGDHPLAPWAALELAELLSQTEPEAAARTAAPLAERAWAGRSRARVLEATALAAAGREGEAVPKLRTLVAEASDRTGAASSAMPLARILESRTEDPEALEEALALYRRVATRAPLTAAGRRAQERARQVLQRLPAERRQALAEVPLEDAFARAHALYGAVRHQEAEQAFEALAERLEDDPEKRCEADLYRGKAMLRRRARDKGAELLVRVAERCTDPEVRARARFLAARARARLGENTEAIAHYGVVEQEAPDSRLADDALFRSALAARDEGDLEGMAERLERLPAEYPDGDMRPEARFLLAWRARAEGEWDRALEQLDRLMAEGVPGHREGAQGRIAYWHARTLADAGRESEAVEAYASLMRRWPLSYHAQHALARLDQLDPDRAAAERARLDAPDDPSEGLTFAPRAELDDLAFVRALELLRVGEVDRAVAELRHLGALGAGADKELLWIVAAVLDRAGAHPEASRLVRTRLRGFRRTVPTGRSRHLWRLAYPRAFHPLIESVAEEADVPASFVRAVAREESAFDPEAVSVAHARGLIQLMRPTARRFARQLDLPTDAASLHDPEINLRVGSRFVAYLWERYRDNPAVVPAAYNAGEGAADRWLRAHPDFPLDRWVEEIPYDETRRYTRRVLETWGIYRFLDDGEVPTLSSELPER